MTSDAPWEPSEIKLGRVYTTSGKFSVKIYIQPISKNEKDVLPNKYIIIHTLIKTKLYYSIYNLALLQQKKGL